MKKVFFLLIAIIFAIQGWTQTDIQIGSGTTYYYDPLPGWYGWNRSAYLYKASEINAGGVINSISFQIQSASSGTNAKLKIYLLESSMTTMPGLSATNWNALKTGSTLVYTNNAFAGSPTGWKTITLDLPYAYSGLNNLLVLVEGEGCSTSGGCYSQCYNHNSPATHWYSRKDTSAPDDTSGSTSSTGEEGKRANIIFNISPLGDYCYPPAQLTAINIAQYSADLTWTTDPSGSSYVIQYKPTSSSTWSQEEYSSSSSHSISGLTSNTDYDVRVKSICSSYSNESAWVNINFRTLISCPTPTSLAVPSTGITTTEALVTWSPTINPVNWNEGYLLQYKPNNVSDWDLASSVSAIQDTFYLIQGLLPSTGYSIRLKAVCEPGVDSSAWTSTVNFVTGCDIISQFPWSEGFENDWSPAVAPGNKPSPNCWIVIDKGGTNGTYQYWWKSSANVDYPGTSHSGTRHAACYTDYGTSSHNDWLITPQIALTGNERLRFWAMRASNSTSEPDEISIFISEENTVLDTTGMGTFDTLSGFTRIFNQLLPSADWQQYELNLNQYSGNRYIAFVRQGTPDGYYLRLDDVEISELPTCNRPTNVVASNNTTTDAEISWVNGSSTDASWWIYYKQSSATTYDSVLANSNPYTLTNLIPSSGYDVYVVTDCSPELSEASPISNFRTLCDAITTFPWAEGFETDWTVTTIPGNATAPDCWINVNNGYYSYYNWQRNTGTSYARTGSGAATMYGGYYSATSAYTNSDWLISPVFSLQGTEMINFYTKSVSTSYPEDISIYLLDVTTNGDITTAADTADFVRIMSPELQTTSWLFHEISLPYTGNYRIAFVRNARPGGQYLCLDDITISEMPTCPSTYNLTSTLRSSTSVDLNWMQNGNGSGWIIAYGDTTGFDPSTVAQPITISSTDPVPYTITGLTPQTPYSFAVRQNCDNGAWSNIVSVVTPANAATLPYSHSFEDVTENNVWSFINGTQTNQWVIGTAADTLGANGLYISNDQGVTNAYTGGSSNLSRVYAYRDFEVPVGVGELELSFDWRAQGGVAQNDFLRMYLVPLDANITAGNIPPNGLDASAQIGNYAGLGEHWLSQSNVWQHKTMRINSLQFPNLAGRTWRLLVHWRNESSTTTGIQPPAAVDNINLSVVACPTPSALVASNPTTTSIDLAWQENGQATNWVIEYKENSSITWNQANATSNPFTLTGLNNSSTYQARVRSLCSTNDTSFTSLTISFNTACDIITSFPWSEGFESSWVASQAPGNASAPNCWINVNNGTNNTSYYWMSSTTAHTGNGAAACYTDGSSGNNDWLITPVLSLTGNERLRFWAMNHSSATGELDEISIWISDVDLTIDITNMGASDSISGFTQIYQTGIPIGSWQQYEVNLNQYSGNRYIAFVRKNNPTNGWYLRLDDVLVEPIPACARPTNVTSVSNTQNSIEISWLNGNTTDASWYVYYRPSGTTDYDSVLVNSNPYILSGLISSTVYDIYVKTDCSTDLSEASPVVNLATACGIISSFPWSEGFESTNWAPAVVPGNKPAPNCWTVVDKGGVNGTYEYWWKHSSDPSGYAGDGSHSGNGHAMCYTDYGTTNHNDWLITPQIALTGGERLRFWAMRANNSTSEPDEISVYISDVDAVLDTTGMGQNGNMPNFTQIFTQMLPSGSWQEYEVNLSQYSGNRYIAFVRQNTPDGFYLRLDDVLIDALPSCAKPTNVATANGIGISVDVSFTLGNTTDNSWYIYYKPTASTGWDSINVTSNPATLSNLTLQTTYQIYVKTDCGNGEISEASNIITYTTPCYLSAINTFPYTEGFENGLSCWQINSSIPAADWTSEISGTWPTATPHGGIKMIRFNSNNLTSQWSIIYSPVLDFPNDQYQVSFWLFKDNDASYLSTADRVELYVNSTASTTGATLLGTVNRSINLAPIETSIGWYQYSFTLPSGTTGNQYVILKGLAENGRNIYVDDLTVDASGGTPCSDPISVLVSNVGTTTADVAWTAGGSETSWEVRLGTTGTPVTVTSPTYPLTGLTSGITYTVYVRANCGTGYSSWVASTPFTTTSAPVIVTNAATSIAQTSVTLNGAVTLGPETITAQGFEWREIGAATWTTVNATGTTITYNLTGLTANTNYEFKAFATTASGTIYGTTLTFTTLPEGVTPTTVVTNAATSIAQTTATLNGTVTPGTETITAQGFEWRAVGASTWTTVNATGTTITHNLTGLIHNTAYEFKAFATTASGTEYGATLSFTTLPNVATIVVTTPATNLDGREATLNGTVTAGTETITAQGFEWKAASATTWTNVTATLTGNAITHNLTGLTPNTDYEFRAYATTASGTINGTTLNFSTLGLHDAEGNSISVKMYPNPATNETKLIVRGVNGETKIVLSDVQGRILNTINTKAVNGVVEQNINVNNLAKGVYYVRIQNSTTSRTQKLIVQ